MALVETNNLQMHFYVKNFWGKKSHVVKAVDGVSFHIDKGETFGLVGESGCGKSTLGRTIIRMYEPTGGTVSFDGDDITNLKGDGLQPYHRRMQIIFQDPYSALDPYHNVGEIIREPMSLYMNEPKDVLDERIAQLLPYSRALREGETRHEGEGILDDIPKPHDGPQPAEKNREPSRGGPCPPQGHGQGTGQD